MVAKIGDRLIKFKPRGDILASQRTIVVLTWENEVDRKNIKSLCKFSNKDLTLKLKFNFSLNLDVRLML